MSAQVLVVLGTLLFLVAVTYAGWREDRLAGEGYSDLADVVANLPRPVSSGPGVRARRVRHEAGVYLVEDPEPRAAFATTDEVLARCVAAELDRVDPLPPPERPTSTVPRPPPPEPCPEPELEDLIGLNANGEQCVVTRVMCVRCGKDRDPYRLGLENVWG